MLAVELMQVGDEVGVVLPQEVLNRLKLQVGDELHLGETAGGLFLSKYLADAEAQTLVPDQLAKD